MKWDQRGPKKTICCLKVPFFRGLPGVSRLMNFEIHHEMPVFETRDSVARGG